MIYKTFLRQTNYNFFLIPSCAHFLSLPLSLHILYFLFFHIHTLQLSLSSPLPLSSLNTSFLLSFSFSFMLTHSHAHTHTHFCISSSTYLVSLTHASDFPSLFTCLSLSLSLPLPLSLLCLALPHFLTYPCLSLSLLIFAVFSCGLFQVFLQ